MSCTAAISTEALSDSPAASGNMLAVTSAQALSAAWVAELSEGRFSDVTFCVDGRSFRLSRLPFAVASPAFAAMLFPSEAHSCPPPPAKRCRVEWTEHHPDAVVTLQDMSAGTFEQLARYVYRTETELTAWNVLQVHKMADMYQIRPLIKECDDVIERLLQKGEPDDVLGLINAEMETSGTIKCYEQYALEQGNMLLKSSSFPLLHRQTVEWLLSSKLEASEDDVWLACYGWAHQVTKLGGTWQDALRPLCDQIRFTLISQHIFDTQVAQSGLLTSERVIGILLHSRGSVLLEAFPGPRYVPFTFDPVSAAPGTTIGESGSTVTFGNATNHRCVFAVPGIESGVHSWTIIWTQTGCCGFAGLATSEEVSRGSNKDGWRFLSRDRLKQMVGFDGRAKVIVPKKAGERVAFTVNMDLQTVTCQSSSGQRWHGRFRHTGKVHPAIDSDENNEFRICAGVQL